MPAERCVTATPLRVRLMFVPSFVPTVATRASGGGGGGGGGVGGVGGRGGGGGGRGGRGGRRRRGRRRRWRRRAGDREIAEHVELVRTALIVRRSRLERDRPGLVPHPVDIRLA